MPILHYKGINIFFTDEGKGNAVVLLHGFLENSAMWDDIKESLKINNRIITIDLPGHGQTGCLGYVHTMEMMAETVEAVLQHLKIRKSTIIGHSMGGYVALAYAEKNPDGLKGLVLMNSTSRADTEEKKKNRDRAIKAVRENHRSFIRLSISNLFRPKNRKVFSEEVNKTKKEALKTPVQGIIAALEGMKNRNDREVLLHFSPYKKMMIIGKKDPVLDYASLIEQTQNSDIEIIECPDGHMSHIENKKNVVPALKNFLKTP
ncbi:alpha/beta fold hydrolase [Abyssalbus ytuae]|uniref:Alpha/beta hydrolase n=1 Tax=Abyssalbus ytuae TaxID=2926907 RepID=A0A9E7CU52_9FLAO|nr:alpha/beta hydrolase [Abyssalbus ytuae]UOB19451.1 alpha/beta hydrolase [Abyssalbus ytuae]